MKEIMSQDLKAIMEASSAPMISIYLSKESGALDNRALNEKWKESLNKAEILLLKDYSRSFVDAFMQPLRHDNSLKMMEQVDKGLIVFYSSQEKGYLKVQSSINDLTVVADTFHIKPLLRIKNTERGFFLVSMSGKAINVMVETNGHLYRMESFKNEGHANDSVKNPRVDSRDFIAQTAVDLNKLLSAYKLPIILAGVKDHLGHMKKLLDHSMILEESIVGNVERVKTDELRSKCFEILEPYYFQKEIDSIAELNVAVKQNFAITYIEDIAVSAIHGKIKKLFVVENKQVWGSINKYTGEIFVSPRQTNSHDDDILDDICQIVLSKGGEVVVLKDAAHVKGYVAAAVVTDRSHLYDFNQASYYSIPG